MTTKMLEKKIGWKNKIIVPSPKHIIYVRNIKHNHRGDTIFY